MNGVMAALILLALPDAALDQFAEVLAIHTGRVFVLEKLQIDVRGGLAVELPLIQRLHRELAGDRARAGAAGRSLFGRIGHVKELNEMLVSGASHAPQRIGTELVLLLDLAQQIGKFDRGHRGIRALVAGLGAGALDRLLDGIGGQHAERHRNAGVVRDPRQAAGAFACDVIEMRGRALDDGTERDDGVVAPAQRQLARHDRQVERARRAHDFDLLVAGAMAPEHVDGAAHQLVDDEVVETRGENRKAQFADLQIAFEGFDDP